MKVSYLCSAHPPYDKRVHYKISNSLAKYGYKVINIHPNIKKENLMGNISIDGFTRKNGYINRLISLINLYKKGKEISPNIIIAPEPDSLVVAYFLKLFDKNNIKVIFDCHEWYEIHFKEKIDNKIVANLLNNITAFILRNICKRIDAVLCVNDTMKNKYLQFNKNSFCIPNSLSVDPEQLDSNIQRDKCSFIFVGNFCDKRQETILIDAAKRLKKENSKAKIRILGGYLNDESYEDNRNEYRLLIEENNIEDNIEIIPWMSPAEAKDFMKGHLAGITRFDSYLYGEHHCLPNKIFDYMSANLAVITCEQNKETSTIVKENKCGIAISEESGEALANGILKMVDNIDDSIRMGENAYKTIFNKYNWDQYEVKISEILKSI